MSLSRSAPSRASSPDAFGSGQWAETSFRTWDDVPMTSHVTASEIRLGPSAGVDISPELALVDPELAEAARAALTPADTISGRPVSESFLSRPPISADTAPALAVEPNPRRSGRRPPPTVVMLGFAAVLVLAVLLADVRVEVGKTPASADVLATSSPAVPATSPTTKRAGSKAAPRSRDAGPAPARPHQLAWAPYPAASAYHVELFSGPQLVFSANTQKPHIVVPRSWQLDGRGHTLKPGTYRWYVWPVVGGQRAVRAIVQTKLVVSTS